jgi:hypothetical protein
MCRPDKKDRASESAESKGRPGMPNEASVLSEKTFTSPKGKQYRIIKTDEMDPYDAPAPPKAKRRRRR